MTMPTAANWLELAQAHHRAERYEDALAFYEQALTLDPDFFQASQGKAEMLMALERYEEALSLWKRLSERAPGDASIAEQRDRARQEAERQAFAGIPSGALLHTCAGHTDWVYMAVWSPDGARLASASRDQTVRIWKA